MRAGFDRLADLAGAFDDARDEVDLVLREVISLAVQADARSGSDGLTTLAQDIGRPARSGAWSRHSSDIPDPDIDFRMTKRQYSSM